MALIAHRDIAGEHEPDPSKCWCDPVVIDISPDDPRTAQQIADEILAALKVGEA